MTEQGQGDSPAESAPRGKNIVIFSDGTGQRGGIYFDETRTNVYKMFRATRIGPDTCIEPSRQVAFYDPGLGTQAPGGSTISRAWRSVYNFVSRATGLGITHNIIDCYAAVIRLWNPGDRIYLFGFSRGAYTVRCVASVLCYCGIPSRAKNGEPLKRDPSSTFKIATEAVKGVYQHVSSSRDAQFFEQRRELAEKFRSDYGCGQGGPTEFPFFVGVFDTVAALVNRGSLIVLSALFAAIMLAASGALAYFSPPEYGFGYWLTWLAFDAFVAMAAAYVYTHLKFSFRLTRSRWWETVHLTTFRQKFYDNLLDIRIPYARHAISIDERRSDFARVKWGNREAEWSWKGAIDHFQQIWFAGNHSDIGGGYAESESRLSDIALDWMIGETQQLGNDGLIVDRSILQPKPSYDGMQHDETGTLVFRLAGKSDRELVTEARLHPTVEARFELDRVLQFDVEAPYRPESLRSHPRFEHYFANVPLPRVTCRQALDAAWKKHRATSRTVTSRDSRTTRFFANAMEMRMDRWASCTGLLAFLAGILNFGGIILYQIFWWLADGRWRPVPLSATGLPLKSILSDWIGLQSLFDWFLQLPLSLIGLLLGVFVFWGFGVLSARLYDRQVRAKDLLGTPSQTHA